MKLSSKGIKVKKNCIKWREEDWKEKLGDGGLGETVEERD